MASSYGLQAQGQVAFTQTGQRAVPLRGGSINSGGGPDSAASTPDRRSNDRREQQQQPPPPPQLGESKDGIPRQEEGEEPSELRQPKVSFSLWLSFTRAYLVLVTYICMYLAPRFESIISYQYEFEYVCCAVTFVLGFFLCVRSLVQIFFFFSEQF